MVEWHGFLINSTLLIYECWCDFGVSFTITREVSLFGLHRPPERIPDSSGVPIGVTVGTVLVTVPTV